MMSTGTVNCSHCNALYQVIRAEAGPETTERDVACRVCGGPLPAREGQLVLKYFLLRKAIGNQKWGANPSPLRLSMRNLGMLEFSLWLRAGRSYVILLSSERT